MKSKELGDSENHGERGRKNIKDRGWGQAMKLNLLAMALLLHSLTHNSSAHLHKIKPAKIPAKMSNVFSSNVFTQELLTVDSARKENHSVLNV